MKPKNLLVAATSAEIIDVCGSIAPYQVIDINENWSALITGVGMVPTVFHLTKALSNGSFAQIVNVGLAGAINRNLNLGQVVNVVSDELGFWGAEDKGDFLSVFDLNLQFSNEAPFQNKMLVPKSSKFDVNGIDQVNGITVQTVTGSDSSIQLLSNTYSAEVESMEGAAVFYVANQFDIPALQIRAISNFVEPRNRDNWKINEAMQALNSMVKSLLIQC